MENTFRLRKALSGEKCRNVPSAIAGVAQDNGGVKRLDFD
jgi:hypothetical protein